MAVIVMADSFTVMVALSAVMVALIVMGALAALPFLPDIGASPIEVTPGAEARAHGVATAAMAGPQVTRATTMTAMGGSRQYVGPGM
jgi:hypothetical protein